VPFRFLLPPSIQSKWRNLPGACKPAKKPLEPFKQIPLPLFFPIKEVLSFYPGFIKSYEERELAFYAIYYDLCKALTGAPDRGKCTQEMAFICTKLEDILQGK
jgi:hypothetical protein